MNCIQLYGLLDVGERQPDDLVENSNNCLRGTTDEQGYEPGFWDGMQVLPASRGLVVSSELNARMS